MSQRPVPPPIRVRPPRPRRRAIAKKRTEHPRRRGARGGVRRELSAGGVVVRYENKQWLVALLKTEHKRGAVWVLPKGHVELHTGERISEAARREVEEEAGVRDLSVKDQLGVTRFSFQVETGVVHKTVHYFLMTTSQRRLTPQLTEGMIDAAWFPIEEAKQRLAYDTDQDIVQRAHDRILGRPRQPVPARPAPRPRPRGSGGRRLRIHL